MESESKVQIQVEVVGKSLNPHFFLPLSYLIGQIMVSNLSNQPRRIMTLIYKSRVKFEIFNFILLTLVVTLVLSCINSYPFFGQH